MWLNNSSFSNLIVTTQKDKTALVTLGKWLEDVMEKQRRVEGERNLVCPQPVLLRPVMQMEPHGRGPRNGASSAQPAPLGQLQHALVGQGANLTTAGAEAGALSSNHVHPTVEDKKV